MNKDFSRCSSCNKPFIEHLGVIGKCAQVQECRAALTEILGRLEPGTYQKDLMLYKFVQDVLDKTKQ